MKTTVNERVKLISERFCNGNISELARIVGLNQSALRDVVGANRKVIDFVHKKIV